LNVHAGITPLYRGVHGGYWALAEDRPDLVGTTVHLVDEGVDTGPVVERRTFSVEREDSFATYPYLHTAHGLPGLLAAVERALAGELRPVDPLDLPSRVRYHPTLWGYLVTRARRGVR
ncbi:MAG: formyl transferase, partial [Actinomycetota bacterium]|nr:formyl transferase [Actinomycetota bacterium]